MKVTLGRGSVVVRFPSRELMSGLSRFRHTKDGSGEYEQLYTLSVQRDSLVTMPGFAKRVISMCPEHRIIDERIPLPVPDIGKALQGVDPVWHGVVKDALAADGGTVAIPSIFGTVQFASAIARAFPRDRLAERGTPTIVVAVKDHEAARRVAFGMRSLLPGRDIGIGECDGDDILVCTYGTIDKYSRASVGIIIGDDIACEDPGKTFVKRAATISAFRNAARWGVYETAGGGCEELDMAAEGLFGPIVASASYNDAVKANVGAPVTVCWLKAPQPNSQWGSAPLKALSALAMGPEFMRMVSEIAMRTKGCIVCSDATIQQKLLNTVYSPGLAVVNRKMSEKDRRIVFGNIETGGVSLALVTWDSFPPATCQGVMVAVTCGGKEFAGAKFPWRTKDKVYIVDFVHDWDVHNGRPGVIARNDEARKRRYADMGFFQMFVADVNHLPFIG